MNTYDFIKANIGNTVSISGDRDLGMNGDLKSHIRNKTKFTLTRLTKGGMAIVSDINGKEYSVPPSNIVVESLK